MVIQIDSREKRSELKRILKQLDALGIKYFVSKLPVGDYMSLDNARFVIDRKQNLLELCGNVTQEHERFRAELIRARENGIKVVILCEHGDGIEQLEDIIFWQNPRRKQRVKKDGRWTDVETKATTGETLYRILQTIAERYDVDFYFCKKEETGGRIVELLNENSGRD